MVAGAVPPTEVGHRVGELAGCTHGPATIIAPADASGPGGEISLLGQARRRGPPRSGSAHRGLDVAGHLEQVRAGRVEPVVAGQPVVQLVEQAPARPPGRRTMAAATARLSVTIGLPVIRSSSP